MKVVLFCGGLGTRLRDYAETTPKPLAPLGDRPILWHLMKYYAHFGHKEFILCLGFKASMIKEYFLKYDECVSNDFVLSNGKEVQLLKSDIQDWKITFVNTGMHSNIGQRLMAVKSFVDKDEQFLANYSDCLTDLDLNQYIDDFNKTNNTACFISVPLQQSYHSVVLGKDNKIEAIQPIKSMDICINGGYFVFRKDIFDYIEEGEELVEHPFQRLLDANKLMTNKYEGFWKPMDTFKDKIDFDRMVANGHKPWMIWDKK